MLADPMNRSALTECDGFKIFNADATNETKIHHDKI